MCVTARKPSPSGRISCASERNSRPRSPGSPRCGPGSRARLLGVGSSKSKQASCQVTITRGSELVVRGAAFRLDGRCRRGRITTRLGPHRLNRHVGSFPSPRTKPRRPVRIGLSPSVAPGRTLGRSEPFEPTREPLEVRDPPGRVGHPAGHRVPTPRTVFACAGCGATGPKWTGRCGGCGAWGSVREWAAGPAAAAPAAPPSAPPTPEEGAGGSPPDSATSIGCWAAARAGLRVLLAGEPGIGKSTLLLQVVGGWRPPASVPGGLGRGVPRPGGGSRPATRGRTAGAFAPGRDLAEVLATAAAERPFLLAVDSIQTLRDTAATQLPGGPAQVRLVHRRARGARQEPGIAVMLAGHVTKDGELAGPRTLEHAVDVVLTFDGDPRSGLRVVDGRQEPVRRRGRVGLVRDARRRPAPHRSHRHPA